MTQVGTGPEPIVPAFLSWGDGEGQLHFDVVMTEDHEFTAEVTDHNVEQGSDIVDNVRPNPSSITLDVFVSNTPIYAPGSDAEVGPLTLLLDPTGPLGAAQDQTLAARFNNLVANGDNHPSPTQLTANVLQFTADTDYVQNACNQLVTLMQTATLLNVTTPRRFYSDMVISSIRMHRDKSTGTGSDFTVTMRQIRIVQSAVVAAPLPSIARAAPTNALGKKDTTNASGPKESNFVHEGKANGSLTGTHSTGIPVAP